VGTVAYERPKGRTGQSYERVIRGESALRGTLADHAELPRPGYGLGAPAHGQLFEQLRNMGLDRVWRDLEALGDLLVRAPGGQQLEHFAFPVADAERLECRGVGLERRRGF